MNTKLAVTALLLLSLVVTPFALLAQDADALCDVVGLFGVWARATPPGAPTGAVYGVLANLGTESDTLVSVVTDIAGAAEIHEMTMGANDVMQMSPVEGGLAVEPGNFVELAPGGTHIMLMNLTQGLEPGQTFELVLTFEQAGEVSVPVLVRSMAEADTGMSMHGVDTHSDVTPEATPEPVANMDVPDACARLHVLGGWARAAGAGMPNSAAYALLLNLTDTDDVLLSVNSDAADAVELHEMAMGANDVMQMRPVEGGISVPAGSYVQLQPGGFHVMLIGLTQPLDADTTLDLTLTFAEAGDVTLTVPVREPVVAPMSGG